MLSKQDHLAHLVAMHEEFFVTLARQNPYSELVRVFMSSTWDPFYRHWLEVTGDGGALGGGLTSSVAQALSHVRIDATEHGIPVPDIGTAGPMPTPVDVEAHVAERASKHADPGTLGATIDAETDQRFWAATGYKPGRKLDPRDREDRKMVATWLAIRGDVARDTGAALARTLTGPAVATAVSGGGGHHHHHHGGGGGGRRFHGGGGYDTAWYPEPEVILVEAPQDDGGDPYAQVSGSGDPWYGMYSSPPAVGWNPFGAIADAAKSVANTVSNAASSTARAVSHAAQSTASAVVHLPQDAIHFAAHPPTWFKVVFPVLTPEAQHYAMNHVLGKQGDDLFAAYMGVMDDAAHGNLDAKQLLAKVPQIQKAVADAQKKGGGTGTLPGQSQLDQLHALADQTRAKMKAQLPTDIPGFPGFGGGGGGGGDMGGYGDIAQAVMSAASSGEAPSTGDAMHATLAMLRAESAQAAAAMPGQVVGLMRRANGTWQMPMFGSVDDADDWFGDLAQHPSAFLYLAYFDKQDPMWPHPLNEAVGHGQAQAQARPPIPRGVAEAA